MSKVKIKVNNLIKKINSTPILQGVNLEIETGSSLVIIGASGSGKSLLIKAIIGLTSIDSGNIFIDDQDITNFSMRKRFKIMSKCGFLFQGGALFDSLTVQENIIFYAQKAWNLSNTQKRNLAAQKLESVGLTSQILDLHPIELSGGMQKRVALARAICTDPEIIFFDEPTTGLDPIMSNLINELIVQNRQKLGATSITITHDISSAYKIATNIAMLYRGKIIWHDKIENLDKTENPFVNQFISGRVEGPIVF